MSTEGESDTKTDAIQAKSKRKVYLEHRVKESEMVVPRPLF